MSGNIEFDAPLAKGGRYEFTSHSGNVRIVLSGNTGFELDADTFSGSVRSDVPVTLRAIGRTDPAAAAATAPSAAPTATPAPSCPSAATADRSSLPRSRSCGYSEPPAVPPHLSAAHRGRMSESVAATSLTMAKVLA